MQYNSVCVRGGTDRVTQRDGPGRGGRKRQGLRANSRWPGTRLAHSGTRLERMSLSRNLSCLHLHLGDGAPGSVGTLCSEASHFLPPPSASRVSRPR